MKRTFSEAEINDMLDDAIEIDSDAWRHGRKIRYVFKVDGTHWAAWIDCHHDEGLQIFGSVEAVEVRQVERTVLVWEKVP